MGMGGNENFTFSHFQLEEEKQPVSGATSASPGTSADGNALDCHSTPANAVSFTLLISATENTITSKAAVNWQNMSTRMGM